MAADPSITLSQTQSWVSEFELEGVPEKGQLTLFTPIGSTAAQVAWTATSAQLHTQGRQRNYASIADLLFELTGAELPLAALFAWLKGQPEQASGWQPDLSLFSVGKITARRDYPLPQAEIRVVLEP